MGVPRHAFLAFLNNGVMGSMFTKYKSPALVNLDWTTTFTPELLRKDLDLGLALGREMDVPMPVTAATREVLQTHFGAAMLQKNPEEYIQKDFAALIETMALAAGMKLTSENKDVPTGLGALRLRFVAQASLLSLPGLTRQSMRRFGDDKPVGKAGMRCCSSRIARHADAAHSPPPGHDDTEDGAIVVRCDFDQKKGPLAWPLVRKVEDSEADILIREVPATAHTRE